eukprot:1038599-Pleurochrysis_carterae.AAC.1
MRKKRAKIRKRAGTWLRETRAVVIPPRYSEIDGQGEAIVVEVLFARFGGALQLGDLVAQPL